MCYWLKTNFKSELFEGSKRLIEVAHSIEEIKTICWCERKATMNARIKDGQIMKEWQEVEIWWNESYISLCPEHYLLKKLR
jgi:thymidine kinase